MNSVIQRAIETLQDQIKRTIDQVGTTTDIVDQAFKEYRALTDRRGRELDKLDQLEKALNVLEELDLGEGE